MSKCDLRITFDKPDRTYRGGERVTGEVHIQVNRDIRCNGIVLNYYWRTHGRGNTARGTKHEIRLAESALLQAGEELHLPFEFTADLWPLTYHGHYIYLDHYVHVAVDVPWAIDPKLEEDFILLPGECPPEFTGDRGEIVELREAKTTELTGIVKYIVFGLIGLVLIMLAFAFVVFVPILLIGGGGYWIWKKLIASRVGKVEWKIPHVIVGPGEQLPLELKFTAKKTFPINGINAKITAVEAATSGSGTDETTHHHTVYEELIDIRSAGSLATGEEVNERIPINFPQTTAWSLSRSDNVLKWTLEVRIDIPRFPDWSDKKEFQVIPMEFLESPALPSPQTKESDSGVAEGFPATAFEPHASRPAPPPPVATEPLTTPDGVLGENMGPLLVLLDQILAAGRFGNERSAIADAAAGHTYDVTIELNRVSTTFGFSGDSRYEDGRTVLGKLAGTEHEVQLFAVPESNETLDDLSRGDTWQTLVRVAEWDSLYDRLVLRELPFD